MPLVFLSMKPLSNSFLRSRAVCSRVLSILSLICGTEPSPISSINAKTSNSVGVSCPRTSSCSRGIAASTSTLAGATAGLLESFCISSFIPVRVVSVSAIRSASLCLSPSFSLAVSIASWLTFMASDAME